MVERDMDWIDHNQILNCLISFLSLIYGCMFLFGQKALWDVYFNDFINDDTHYNDFEIYITTMLGFLFIIYSSHSYNLSRIDTSKSNSLSLITSVITWLIFFIINWCFLNQFTVAFKAFNSIISFCVLFYACYISYLYLDNPTPTQQQSDASSV